MARTRTRGLLIPLGSAGVILVGCQEEQQLPVEVPPPSFTIQVAECHIYDPCWSGGGWRINRVFPNDPPGDTIPCEEVEGGCFPIGEPPIIGGGVYYGYNGVPRSIAEAAQMHGWSNIQSLTSTHRAQIVMAIREIKTLYPECSAISTELESRVYTGAMWEGHDSYANGEWVADSPPGVIFVNTTPGFDIWEEDGTYDHHHLRRMLTHEGIHMWFDSQVGHSSGYTEEQQAAFDAMRDMCGAT